ncbi:TRAP transporter substrate-binding protein [Shimia aestuarii]|uniref:TRAP-type C4-dicarboxylate transport system, substrate-binding protein n=1 Tax=Shimia aestuarii TaxID=254406 RepID=A0A1I4SLK7_9RHOB|nr:TRAP transporter substrate-binding protein [Shimia aestuarii]SFM65304.1 TRAP-type C4-dicarboxylate transport system, substrate-binding protein [Shimia aestuarii]
MSFTRFLGAAGVSLALAMASPVTAQTVKIALDSAKDLENSGTYVWAHAFSEYLNANGMPAEEYERGALGAEAEKMDQVQQGLLEVSMSDTKGVGKLDGHITPITLPYLFPDWATVDRGLSNGMLEKINAGTTEQGVRVLALVALGSPAGIFNTKKTVNSAADMADLRMRALDDTQIGVYKMWGTNGTIVAWDEVPNALQTGIADGYMNPPMVPLMFGHTGFIKYFTNAKVGLSSRTAIVSEDWFQGLSAEQQKTVMDAAAAATATNRAWLETRSAELDKLREAGIEVTELTPEAWAEFKELSTPLHNMVPLPEGALAAWQAAIGE